MKTETVIFPNPNQLILIRKLQAQIGGIPVFPICIRCQELKELSDKISKSEISNLFFEDGSVFLSVKLEINQKETMGRIELSKSLSELKIRLENTEIKQIKKISPFRIVKMESEEFKNGVKWKITAEKWVKIK